MVGNKKHKQLTPKCSQKHIKQQMFNTIFTHHYYQSNKVMVEARGGEGFVQRQ